MKKSGLLKALVIGVIAGCALVIAPLAGNPAMLCNLKPWILVLTGAFASLFQPTYNPFAIFSRQGDRMTGAQIIWTVYITQLAAVLEAGYLRFPQSLAWNWYTFAALAMAISGLSLRTWAVLKLGRSFTMHVAVQNDQPVVNSGPFAVVRHPSYLGAFLLYLGTALFLHAWFAAVIAAALMTVAFVRRINLEEKMLSGSLNSAYNVYRKQVRFRLFPGIW